MCICALHVHVHEQRLRRKWGKKYHFWLGITILKRKLIHILYFCFIVRGDILLRCWLVANRLKILGPSVARNHRAVLTEVINCPDICWVTNSAKHRSWSGSWIMQRIISQSRKQKTQAEKKLCKTFLLAVGKEFTSVSELQESLLLVAVVCWITSSAIRSWFRWQSQLQLYTPQSNWHYRKIGHINWRDTVTKVKTPNVSMKSTVKHSYTKVIDFCIIKGN